MPRDLPTLLHALADELDAAHDDLEAVAAMLCGDVELARRHLGTLQAIDAIGQRQAVSAAVLRAPDPLDAVADVPLDAIRRRLLAAND